MRLLSSAAVICAALFSGTILHAQDPELLAKRQCRSVHINQQWHPSQASALYNVVKAKTSVPGTYFCAPLVMERARMRSAVACPDA